MIFECPRCNFTSSIKGNFVKHINTKRVCSPTKEDVSLDELRLRFDVKSYICDRCSKKFNHQQNLSRHRKICKHPHPTIDISMNDSINDTIPTHNLPNQEIIISILQEMQEIRTEIKKLQTTQMLDSLHTINNITQTNNITINITSFGSENIKHIEESKEFLTACFMDKNIVDIIEKIHFDNEYPQNRNVRLKSLKHGMMETYVDGRWIITDKNDTFDRLVDKGTNILKFHTKRNKQKILEECDEDGEDFDGLKEYIDFVQDDDDLKKPLLKKLDLLFVNDTNIMLESGEFE